MAPTPPALPVPGLCTSAGLSCSSAVPLGSLASLPAPSPSGHLPDPSNEFAAPCRGLGAFPAWLQAKRPRGFLLFPEHVLPWEHGGTCSSLLCVSHCWGRSNATGMGSVGPCWDGAHGRLGFLCAHAEPCLPAEAWGWVVPGSPLAPAADGAGGRACSGAESCWEQGKGAVAGIPKQGGRRSQATMGRGRWSLGACQTPLPGLCHHSTPVSCSHLLQVKVRVPGSGSLPIIRRFDLELNMQK